jgi:hypothetical protein
MFFVYSIIGNNNNIYFIELKHTIQIASQYKETAQLDTENGIARTGSASIEKQHSFRPVFKTKQNYHNL